MEEPIKDKNKLEVNKQITKEFGITSWSVDNRVSIIILTLIIVVAGLMAYNSMPRESFPEIVIPTIFVGTVHPGNSPSDMENLVTRPIEKELKSIKGIKKISSTSVQDFSTIIVEFNTDVQIPKALQDVKDAVDKSELPTDLDTDPNVFEVSFSDIPIMFVNISGNYKPEELKAFGEYLQDEIEKLPEVSEAPIRGAMEKEIKINADMYAMQARQVSFADIEQAVAGENLTISGGNLLTQDSRRSVRIAGEFTSVEEIRNIIVKNDNQNLVYLKDIAEIPDFEKSYEEPESYARSFKLPVVTLNIIKRSGENLILASDKIKEIVKEAKANKFPKDLKVTISNDQSKNVRSQVDNLENSIISGVILVVIILMFFMGLRSAIFVGVAIPLSMLMAFMVLDLFDVTLNVMVLFSLVLALGMLVDNGIVVVENIYRLAVEEKKPLILAVKEGVGEIAMPIISSTATTVAAFLPLAFWGGIIGDFMKYLPITLMVTLTASLFVALVANPVLAVMFMQSEIDGKKPNKKKTVIIGVSFIALSILFYFSRSFTIANLMSFTGIFIIINLFFLTPAADWFQKRALVAMENGYAKILHYALKGRKPYWFLLATGGLFIFSIVLLGIRTPNVLFFPDGEPNYINVFIEKPIGTDIEATNALVKSIEDELITYIKPYEFMVESFTAQVGDGTTDPNEGPSQAVTPNKGKITVSFLEYNLRKGVSTNKILEDIRAIVKKYPGAQITASKEQNGPPVGKPINIEISGDDYGKLIAVSEKVQKTVKTSNIQGIEALKADLEVGKPELMVNIDREKAQRLGLSTGSIAMELRTALFGKEISKFKDGEEDYPIQLRIKDEQRYSREALFNKVITFRDKFGKLSQVPIISVVSLEDTSSYGAIKRKGLKRVITLSSNVEEGYNANEIVQELKTLLKDYPEVKFTGEQEEQAESSAFLGKALLIALFLVFLIIVTQFNSLTAPFVIMGSVVFSTIGVFLGLSIFKMDFVIIMTGIGIISLAGVVVNNAIVLIDYTNLLRLRRREELNLPVEQPLAYEDLIESLVVSGKTRLRPVLLTAITTVLGLIPLAIGLNINFFTLLSDFNPDIYYGGDNASFWGPMAWTVIFGLTFATFLTLVIVPVMYLITDKIQRRLDKVKS